MTGIPVWMQREQQNQARIEGHPRGKIGRSKATRDAPEKQTKKLFGETCKQFHIFQRGARDLTFAFYSPKLNSDLGAQKMNIQEQLGAKIRGLRLRKGWSQELLADICGLHRSHMGEIERGHANVTLATLVIIAEKLETTAAALLKPVRIREEKAEGATSAFELPLKPAG